MKVKTSVTLSPEVLAAIDQLAGDTSRSEFIEQLLKHEIRRVEREQRDQRDAELYAEFADELAAEAEETLSFQAPLSSLGDDAAVLLDDDRLAATG